MADPWAILEALRNTQTGVADVAASMGSGMIAQPVAGLHGLATALRHAGKGKDEALRRARESIDATQNALTYEPRSDAGRRGLENIGRVIEPVAEKLQETLVDPIGERSPLAAAAAMAGASVIGGKGKPKGRAKVVKVDTPEGPLYHVTTSDALKKIQQEGLVPMSGDSNWAGYHTPNVYAFENPEDAARWAARMDWEQNKKIGSGKVSILEVLRDPKKWGIDKNDPLSQASAKGKWFTRGEAVPPEFMGRSIPFAQDMVKPYGEPGAWAGFGPAEVRRPVPEAPQAEALRTAQINAAKPKSKGGLGLKKNNTPEERAVAMGYDLDRPLYHGSLSDIKKIDLEKSTGEGHAGRGFYMTPSPEDASLNYANAYGPDPRSKVIQALESRDRPVSKVIEGFYHNEDLSPERLEKVLRGTGVGENLGAVYPVYAKHGREANLVEPKRSAFIEPGEVFNEKLEEYQPGPASKNWTNASRTMEDFGVKDEKAHGSFMEALTEGSRADQIAKALRGVEGYHPDTGSPTGTYGLATEVLRDLDVNTFTHPTSEFRGNLSIAPSHTVALQPEGIVRSRFAAFDPARAGDPDILGFAEPKTLGLLGAGAGGAAVAAPTVSSYLRESKEKREAREAERQRRHERALEGEGTE